MSTSTNDLRFALFFFALSCSLALGGESSNTVKFPLVVSTWPFLEAVKAAWNVVDGGLSALDAVEEGCSTCEELRCDGTVGPGGSPDENGETTIDAMIMNGSTMEVGAVAGMRYVSNGIKAARLVMEHTEHTLLVGEQASIFAISMGVPGPQNLSSDESIRKWLSWKGSNCKPNFRKNVVPADGCGPYRPVCGADTRGGGKFDRLSHDTISMAVFDRMGSIAVGTSTNGATFKVPGRVGDGPIAGSAAYADSEVGACGATGDGDIMMRFLPCYQVVESMRIGMEPKTAAEDVIRRIRRKYPDFVGAVFAVDRSGVHAGASHRWDFQYAVMSPEMDDVQVFTVRPQINVEVRNNSLMGFHE
ncbi:hypothetical protein M569_14648 [Genlisea aurea]|uniref:beta-aspartyl-peptidase n=1 Tax=Genlisea aurea TaxID=192259 RepID=S8DBN4_9LAMI|nr:hypothetical protein M569_14648 [Genlisea aurea]